MLMLMQMCLSFGRPFREPDTVRKIMVQQSKYGRWHVDLESAPRRENSTRPPGQERPSSASAAQPRQHDVVPPLAGARGDVEHQDHLLQSQQQLPSHSGISEGGNSSEDQWERMSNGTAISEPVGNYANSSGKARHGRANNDDYDHHSASVAAKGLVPFAARNLTRLWNLMAGDAPTIAAKSEDDSTALAAEAAVAVVENDHHPRVIDQSIERASSIRDVLSI